MNNLKINICIRTIYDYSRSMGTLMEYASAKMPFY